MANCRSCGALITWIKLVPGGTLHPLDLEPRADGNIQVNDAGEGRILRKAEIEAFLIAEKVAHRAGGPLLPVLYRSHFASCDQAAAWRRRG